ncbi:MAG: sugar phosphate isomerase/epimerase [Oscillospiraceae bacterium]|nr:sugar phosphate isomerase/epimerase [Oscillospiraceae bacterium]
MMIGCRAHDYGSATAQEMARRLKAHGWECGQIVVQKLLSSCPSLEAVSPAMCEDVYRAFTDLGLKTPLLGYYIQPSLPDKDARLAQVELFKKGLDNSLYLGGAYVGTETGDFPVDGPMEERRPLFENLVDSFLRFAEHAEKIGAKIAVEPAAHHTLGTPELVCELLERVDSDRLFIIYDSVNMLKKSVFAEQAAYWQKNLDAFGDRIVVCHIKDGDYQGNVFTECRLGQGKIDYGPLFSFLKAQKREIAVIREGTAPERGEEEREYLVKNLR